MVECGDCRACCQGPDRELVVQANEATWLERTLGADGQYRLAAENGTCIYLGARGCTVYDRRPGICRRFDCRDIAGIPGVPLRVVIAAAQRLL